jgi:class 3 adenylate cyclase/DNA-binding SARP family transcriptional activator
MSQVALTLFGSPSLTEDGVPIDLPSRKALALLAYLAVTGVRHRRASLAALFWPESDRERAQNAMRYTLSLLRRALQGRWLDADRETVDLDGSHEEGVDVLRFRALLAQCRTHGHSLRETCAKCLPLLGESVQLYRGDFLAGFTLRDSVEFDMWQSLEAEALRQELVGALERLVGGFAVQGDVERASRYARRWLALDPLDEAAHRALMRLYAGSGQQTAALRQYEACERVLMNELGVVPSEETRELYAAIKERRVGQPYHRPPLVVARQQVRCLNCSAENSEGARYCMKCGARLALVCAECGSELPPDPEARFCLSCGTEIVAPPATHASDSIPERLDRVMPREFAQRLISTRGEVARERRVVTMLFSDVKGSRSMTEDLDPEEVMEIMEGALDVLIEPITRYEGTLARLIGDAILAFFGAPIAHEDDAERACRAALDIIERAQAYALRLQQQRGIAGFDVRVAIHTGLVVVGEVGPDLRAEYTAMGDAVNVASGMQEAAEPGTVLITEDTHRLIAPLFETEALGPIHIVDRAEPVLAYRVLASADVVGKGRGIAGLASPLVGREAELGALREVLERLQAGVGGIVTVVGEAGIGKSRLVAELQKAAVPLDVTWVEGRCLSYGGSIAYLPWLDMLRGLLGVSVEDPPAEVRRALRRFVETLCPDHLDEVYPYLGRMMSLPLEDEVEARLRGIEPKGLKVLTFRAVERVVDSASSGGPLVLMCEDLHWADPTSLELLEQLLGLTDRTSLLLICAFRPYRGHGCWGIREAAGRLYPHRHSDLYLGALSPSDSEALMGHLLEVEALPRPLRGRVLDHAEGNPFYVEEVIRSLIDSEVLVYDEATAQWQATQQVEDIAIPDTLQGVLMARIDRLQEEVRRVLQMASVIGRIFLHRVLSEIAQEVQARPEPSRRELDANLSALQREEMIRERARVPKMEAPSDAGGGLQRAAEKGETPVPPAGGRGVRAAVSGPGRGAVGALGPPLGRCW